MVLPGSSVSLRKESAVAFPGGLRIAGAAAD